MTDETIPLLGVLQAHRIKRDFGARSERQLQSLVARLVHFAAASGYGRNVFENVYLAGFEHGARMMERALNKEPSP